MPERCRNCDVLLPVVGYSGDPVHLDACPHCGVEHPVQTPGSALLIAATLLAAYFLFLRSA